MPSFEKNWGIVSFEYENWGTKRNWSKMKLVQNVEGTGTSGTPKIMRMNTTISTTPTTIIPPPLLTAKCKLVRTVMI